MINLETKAMAGTVSGDVRDILNLDEDFPTTYNDQANVEAIIGQDARVKNTFNKCFVINVDPSSSSYFEEIGEIFCLFEGCFCFKLQKNRFKDAKCSYLIIFK